MKALGVAGFLALLVCAPALAKFSISIATSDTLAPRRSERRSRRSDHPERGRPADAGGALSGDRNPVDYSAPARVTQLCDACLFGTKPVRIFASDHAPLRLLPERSRIPLPGSRKAVIVGLTVGESTRRGGSWQSITS
jgi:hypothetical protein